MKKQKLLNDMAQIAGGGVQVFSGLRQQVKNDVYSHLNDLATRLNWVPREDHENLQTMLLETQKKLAAVEERLDRLEKTAGKKKTAAKDQ